MNRKLAPVLAAAALLALAGCSTPEAEAYEACQQAIEDHFGDGDIYGFADLDEARVREVDGEYEVASYIHTTNGLGEPVKMKFACQIQHIEGDWKLTDLDLDRS